MMPKVKVLYIISTLKRSGPVNVLYYIIKYLDHNLFEPIILTLSPEERESEYCDFEKLGVSIRCLSMSRKELLLKGKTQFIKQVKEVNPDIIHTHGIRADYLVTKYMYKYNYNHCSTIHNYPYDDYIMAYGKLKGSMMAKGHLSIINKIKNPVSCSNSISGLLKVNHNINASVIQNGIDEKVYNIIDANEKIILRRKMGLPTDKMIFVSSGRLILRKDPVNMIKAFKASNNNRAILILLGDGPLKEACSAEKDSSVVLTGNVNNVVDYLKAADIFVSASKAEGLPMAVLEAMGVGLPLVLSDIIQHKEIFEKNSRVGKLFRVNDNRELSECFKESFSYNLCEMSIQARKTLEMNYSAINMSKSYQKLYEGMI